MTEPTPPELTQASPAPAYNPPYQAPPGWPPVFPHVQISMPPVRQTSDLAVWALVTGVVGLLVGWCLLGLPCLAAVILGHLAMNDTNNEVKSGRGMAVTGLILGYIALVPAIAIFFFGVIGSVSS